MEVIEGDGYIIIAVSVQPRASKNEIRGIHNGRLKIRITDPPVDNSANEGCIRFLSKLTGKPKGNIQIIKGNSAREKMIKLVGVTKKDIENLIALDK